MPQRSVTHILYDKDGKEAARATVLVENGDELAATKRAAAEARKLAGSTELATVQFPRTTLRQNLIDLWTMLTGRPLGAPRDYDANAEAAKLLREAERDDD